MSYLRVSRPSSPTGGASGAGTLAAVAAVVATRRYKQLRCRAAMAAASERLHIGEQEKRYPYSTRRMQHGTACHVTPHGVPRDTVTGCVGTVYLDRPSQILHQATHRRRTLRRFVCQSAEATESHAACAKPTIALQLSSS